MLTDILRKFAAAAAVIVLCTGLAACEEEPGELGGEELEEELEE